jgi:hypothetical protein
MDVLRQGLEVRVDKRRETYFYATLVETKCTPVKEPTGQLKYAHVVLEGSLVRTVLSRTVSGGKWYIAAIDKEPHAHNSFSPDFEFNSDKVQRPRSGDEVYCLRLAGTKRHIEFHDEEFLVYLVLRKVHVVAREAASPGALEIDTFVRIGLLANRGGEIQLEDESEATAVLQEILVKIV